MTQTRYLKIDAQSSTELAGALRMSIVGACITLLSTLPPYQNVPVRKLVSYVVSALSFGQVETVYSETGQLVGAYLWCLTTEEDIAAKLAWRKSPLDLHPSEWQEGSCVLLLEVVAKRGQFRKMARMVRQRFEAQSGVYWINRRRNRLSRPPSPISTAYAGRSTLFLEAGSKETSDV